MGSLDLADKYCTVLSAGGSHIPQPGELTRVEMEVQGWGWEITKFEKQKPARPRWQICTLLKYFAKQGLLPSSRQHSQTTHPL